MKKTKPVGFRQCPGHFPVEVCLGRDFPDWRIIRKPGELGLGFLPPADECYRTAGNLHQLHYRGERADHRFTILGARAFEYDYILNKPPLSNEISILLDGGEHFNFFQQPKNLRNPLLAGSYAVYRKNVMIGEGTGKLCHIYRPEIRDAFGRRVWGDISICGNVIKITIPEEWLADARYPVLVDPIIGTDNAGSLSSFDLYGDDDPADWWDAFFEEDAVVTKFTVKNSILGSLQASFYANNEDYWACNGLLYPILYDNFNDSPTAKLSAKEEPITFKKNDPAGWYSTTMETGGKIEADSQIWFGFACKQFRSRFDIGGHSIFCGYYVEGGMIPNTFSYDDKRRYPFLFSMYFSYLGPESLTRTIYTGFGAFSTPRSIIYRSRFVKDENMTIGNMMIKNIINRLAKFEVGVKTRNRRTGNYCHGIKNRININGKVLSSGFYFRITLVRLHISAYLTNIFQLIVYLSDTVFHVGNIRRRSTYVRSTRSIFIFISSLFRKWFISNTIVILKSIIGTGKRNMRER